MIPVVIKKRQILLTRSAPGMVERNAGYGKVQMCRKADPEVRCKSISGR